jgi:hypothetical protein
LFIPMETAMKLKTLIAVAVAGAFAVPFAAQASADGDRMILAQSSQSGSGSGSDSGTPRDVQGGPRAGQSQGAATTGPVTGAPATGSASVGAIMRRIYDVSRSERGRELMNDILNAAYRTSASAGGTAVPADSQKFAEKLLATCMETGGSMDRILGQKS